MIILCILLRIDIIYLKCFNYVMCHFSGDYLQLRLSVFIIFVTSILVAGSAFGGIPDANNGGTDYKKILAGAVSGGKTIEQAVSDAVTRSPSEAGRIVSAAVGMYPDLAGEIAYSAIMAGGAPGEVVSAAVLAEPKAAGNIITAAVSAAPNNEDAITQAALLAGVGQSTVMAAVVAGRLHAFKDLRGGIGNIETPNRGMGGVGTASIASPS